GLKKLGALDFAGGTVVHISSGMSALVCAIMLGKRRGYGHQPMQPHNLPMTVTGASLLWFGWFGFNAGSALEANGLAASAFTATNTGAAAAALGWMFTEWMSRGKPTVLGAASGAVDALVGLRVSDEGEVAGLDISQHSETAYAAGGGFGEVGSGHPGAFAEARPRVAH